MNIDHRVTILTGGNGVGKTTLLEGAYATLSGHYLRPGGLSALMARGSRISTARSEMSDEKGRTRKFRLVLTPTSSQIFIDNEPATKRSLVTLRPPLCVFTPQRVELIRGQPGVRRLHFDRLAALLIPRVDAVIRSYREAVAQRTACLAAHHPGALDAWEEQLARLGAELVAARLQVLESLAPFLTEEAEQLGLATCQLRYGAPDCELDAKGISRALVASRMRDARLRTTTVGPHRHDVILTIARQPAKTFASQGEQRTLVLALILAEARLIAAWRGSEPLLLLDDPLGELEERRRRLLIARAGALGQTLITSTDTYFCPSLTDTTDTCLVDVSALRQGARPPKHPSPPAPSTHVNPSHHAATTTSLIARDPQ